VAYREDWQDYIPETETYQKASKGMADWERKIAGLEGPEYEKQMSGYWEGMWQPEYPMTPDQKDEAYETWKKGITDKKTAQYQKEISKLKKGAESSSKTKTEAMRLQMGDMAEFSRQKEGQLFGALGQQTSETVGAIDRLLASLIDQTGYTAGLTKQAVGHGAAEKGVLRSGQTAEKLGNVDRAQATEKTRLTAQRNEQVRQVQEQTARAQREVQDRRFKIEQGLKEAEMMGFQDLAYQEKALKMNMEMKQFINDLELSSLATKNLLGGLEALGQIAGWYIGDKYGTPGTKSTLEAPTGLKIE